MSEDKTTRTTKNVGLAVFLVLAVLLGGIYLWVMISIALWSPLFAAITALLLIGGGFLVFSTVRQRLIDRKTDRYDKVEM